VDHAAFVLPPVDVGERGYDEPEGEDETRCGRQESGAHRFQSGIPSFHGLIVQHLITSEKMKRHGVTLEPFKTYPSPRITIT
jgi:hypothetical protein